MQKVKRMLCLLLCGMMALGLAAPMAAGAEEVRTYTVHFYTPDAEGNRHIVKSAEDVTVDGDSLTVEQQKALLGEGYTLAKEEAQALPAAGKEIYVEVKEVPELVPYELHFFYTDREGNRREVSTARLLLPEGAKEISLEDQKKAMKPGWALLREEAFPIPEGQTEVSIELKADREIAVRYVTADGKVISTETLTVPVDKTHLVATDLKAMPEGYRLAEKVDAAIGEGIQSVDVLVEADAREIQVRYVTADGKLIHTETLTVAADKTAVSATDLRELPKGYSLVNKVEAQLLPTTTAIDVLVQKDEPVPTEKVISVHYTTKEGKKILTTNMTVPVDAKSVEAKSLRDVPYGYKLVSTGSLTIDKDNAIHPIVEAEKKDSNKDDVPKTGDSTGILLLAALSGASLLTAAGLSFRKSR